MNVTALILSETKFDNSPPEHQFPGAMETTGPLDTCLGPLDKVNQGCTGRRTRRDIERMWKWY